MVGSLPEFVDLTLNGKTINISGKQTIQDSVWPIHPGIKRVGRRCANMGVWQNWMKRLVLHRQFNVEGDIRTLSRKIPRQRKAHGNSQDGEWIGQCRAQTLSSYFGPSNSQVLRPQTFSGVSKWRVWVFHWKPQERLGGETQSTKCLLDPTSPYGLRI